MYVIMIEECGNSSQKKKKRPGYFFVLSLRFIRTCRKKDNTFVVENGLRLFCTS